MLRQEGGEARGAGGGCPCSPVPPYLSAFAWEVSLGPGLLGFHTYVVTAGLTRVSFRAVSLVPLWAGN